jgi:hypothetical protein
MLLEFIIFLMSVLVLVIETKNKKIVAILQEQLDRERLFLSRFEGIQDIQGSEEDIGGVGEEDMPSLLCGNCNQECIGDKLTCECRD